MAYHLHLTPAAAAERVASWHRDNEGSGVWIDCTCDLISMRIRTERSRREWMSRTRVDDGATTATTSVIHRDAHTRKRDCSSCDVPRNRDNSANWYASRIRDPAKLHSPAERPSTLQRHSKVSFCGVTKYLTAICIVHLYPDTSSLHGQLTITVVVRPTTNIYQQWTSTYLLCAAQRRVRVRVLLRSEDADTWQWFIRQRMLSELVTTLSWFGGVELLRFLSRQ